PAARIGGLGIDVDDELVELRLSLDPSEQARLAALSVDAAAALEGAVREWVPGELDIEIQARVAAALERVGAFGACLIVGGDDRVERFRHPLAAARPVHRLLMAVVVAERHGLHAAATRFAIARPLSDSVRAARRAAADAERAVLDASRPSATYGDTLLALADAYADAALDRLLPDEAAPRTFPDGADFRIEIPSVEGPRVLETVIAAAAEEGVVVNRVSQGSGAMLLREEELREMAALGAEHGIEVSLFVGPRESYDITAHARTEDGSGHGGQLRGLRGLRYAVEDIARAAECGIRSFLIP